MTITITPAEERAAAEFRRLCEIVWWQVQSAARDDLIPLSALLAPSSHAPVVLARQEVALAASLAGASREAIGTILSASPSEVRGLLAQARMRRARASEAGRKQGLRIMTGGRR